MNPQIINLEPLLDESAKRRNAIAALLEQGINSNPQLGHAKVERLTTLGYAVSLSFIADGCRSVTALNAVRSELELTNQAINAIDEAIEAYKNKD